MGATRIHDSPETMELYHKRYGDGPPLVILHGLLGAGGNWHTLGGSVFGEHFATYAVDQRNHGRSPHSDRMDYGAMAEDLLAFLDAEGLDAIHLMGHSMGGKTAMRFALEHPERVERLVVVDIAPKEYPPYHQPILDALRAVDLTTASSRRDVDDRLKQAIASAPVRQFLLKNLSYDGDTGRYTWLANLEALNENYPALNAWPVTDRTFEGPTRFIRGSRSEYVTDDDLDAIRRLFPAADVVTVEAGHWVHADAPDAFARVVLDFLGESEPAGP